MTGKIYSVNEIRDIVNPIASRYGIERVCLFDSCAAFIMLLCSVSCGSGN